MILIIAESKIAETTAVGINIIESIADKSEFALSVQQNFGDPGAWGYNLLFAFLIIVFTFFYTAISINPTQISDDMKRGGGFVPGVKPGEATSGFIAEILDRITLPGAIMLAITSLNGKSRK